MKKLVSILMAVIMMFSVCSATAFAAEVEPEKVNDSVEATMYNVELTSEGIVSITDENGEAIPESLTSSISGYNNGNVSSSTTGFLVWVDASGTGGMGVTVTTSCSTWTGTITFDLISNSGYSALSNKYISSNGTSQYNNLFHSSPAYYLASFTGIPSGHTIYAQVWIYG